MFSHFLFRYPAVSTSPRIVVNPQTTIRQGSHRNVPPSRPIVMLHALEGLHNKCQQAPQLSPFRGFQLIQSGALFKLYDLAVLNPALSATNRLLISLFHKNDLQFRAIKNKSYPAYSLTPRLIAKIATNLAPSNILSPMFRHSIEQEWQLRHEVIAKHVCSVSKITALLRTIHDSKQECMDQHYPENLTEEILTAFLIYIAESRQDILDFVSVVNSCHNATHSGDFSDDHINNGRRAIEVISSLYNEFVQKGESQNERALNKYHWLDSTSISSEIKTNYEDITAYLSKKSLKLSFVLSGHYVYNDNLAVANCVENAYQNLCNIIMYNPDINMFDPTLLPPTLSLNCKMLRLYQDQHFSVANVNAHWVGQKFMDIVSAHPELHYCENNYELDPAHTLDDFIKLMNMLFGSTATSFNELSDQFSDAKRQITFEKTSNNISISIKNCNKKLNKQYVFRFNDTHAGLSGFKIRTEHCDNNRMLKNAGRCFVEDLQQYGGLFSLLALSINEKIELIHSKTSHFTVADATYIATQLPIDTLSDIRKVCSLLQPYISESKAVKSSLLGIFITHNILESAIASDKLDLISIAVELGIDLNKNDFFPLAYTSNPHTLQLLIELGADLHKVDEEGNTYIHIQLESEKVKHLIQCGANPNAKNRYGQTPLHFTSSHVSTELLIAAGADVNAIDSMGKSPLFHAACDKKIAILLNHGCNIHVKDNLGRNALYYASSYTNISLLLEAGVDIFNRDNDGKYAADVISPVLGRYLANLMKMKSPEHTNQDNWCAVRLK